MAGEHVPDDARPGEGLVDLQGGAARVGEDVGDALALEGLDEDIGALARLVGGESGDERFGGGYGRGWRRRRRRGGGFGGGAGNARWGRGAGGDAEVGGGGLGGTGRHAEGKSVEGSLGFGGKRGGGGAGGGGGG